MFPLIFALPVFTLIQIENEQEPIFLLMENFLPVRKYTWIFRPAEFLFCLVVMGSVEELIQITATTAIFGSTLYFWLNQEYPGMIRKQYISWHHYRALWILEACGNSCINRPEVAVHHLLIGILIICGLAEIIKRGLKVGFYVATTLCVLVAMAVTISLLEAFISQSIALASEKRVKEYKLRFSADKSLKSKLRSVQYIHFKTAWICLRYFGMIDFLKFVKKCADILLVILLV